ncbi:four-carbon acid sugar kinase family protein [Homoserinibacter sp. YIM 151385]|uniref:four-carbon acid sugar kinase family protein n=1 Tax=Homoserinibacter sp. YIM 151385 TaxID=2985506 RepID=UPI0022F0EE8A|nr:four-carbon acid sugar kinase family protein [Homoserinibacter sp. YIM 151385]WBU37089.1 hypothetical protein OF852_09145 [Homoserinibacter sp. YIM 151385]
MKTVVLDDDPTGTQSAEAVEVLLEWDADAIREALSVADSVYLLANTRAMSEEAAVSRLAETREQCAEAAARLGAELAFVLRGDSTLRGHVMAETEVFAQPDSVIAFVPAFPAGGRVTLDGVHLVRLDGELVPADRTEYAEDPVFPFDTAVLVDYLAQRTARPAIAVPLAVVRDAAALDAAVLEAAAGSVLAFDAETDADVVGIASAIRAAQAAGRSLVVRSAATLAAELAGVRSRGLLEAPLARDAGRTLLVCGSHTQGASRQLAPVAAAHGAPVEIDTAAALDAPEDAGRAAGARVVETLRGGRLGFLATERVRSGAHDTLDHGERVMRALTTAVAEAEPEVTAVVSKGGITSAEVARLGLGARRARVRGQVAPGVSVWDLEGRSGRAITYVVVPGNVGAESTIVDALGALGVAAPTPAPASAGGAS